MCKFTNNNKYLVRPEDIELELNNYHTQFKDKIIFLNCDNYKDSYLWDYFKTNFNHIGLKKLFAMGFNPDGIGTLAGYDGTRTRTKKIKGTGDFRDGESIDILKKSDIIIGKPPFSLIQEYLTIITEHEKDYIFVGSNYSLNYGIVFTAFQLDTIRLGYTKPRKFIVNDGTDTIKSIGDINWFTSLTVDKKIKALPLDAVYEGNEDKYPQFDNYNQYLINIDRVEDIPGDYSRYMAVPLSFVEKYAKEQFAFVATQKFKPVGSVLKSLYRGKKEFAHDDMDFILEGKKVHTRIVIVRRSFKK